MRTVAAIARDQHQPLVVEEVTLDDLRPDEVRVRLVASGICHTDAIVRDGVYPTPLPAVLGHEGAGIVESVGSMVPDIGVGDHVIMSAAWCGHCNQCVSGNLAYCENLFAQCFGGSRPDGSKAFTDATGLPVSSHFFGQSSFSAVTNASARSLVVIDKAHPLELVAPLGCGLQTGAGAVLHELQPTIGSSVMVIGAGAVGFGGLMAAAATGAAKVIAVDLNDDRLELARELGATDVLNPKSTDLTEAVAALCPNGVDRILDTTANPSVLTSAAGTLGIRGILVTVGAAAPGTEARFEIGLSLVKGWSFKTVVQGSSIPRTFIPELLDLWKRGRFPFDKLIRTYSLEQINQGFADSASGTAIKPVVVF